MKRILGLALILGLLLTGLALGDAELKQTRTEDGLLIEEAYYDGETLVVGEKGFARHTIARDEGGNAAEETWYGADGKPIPGPDGVVTVRREFDEAGRVVFAHYYDAAGEPMLHKGLGAYGEAFSYGADGLVAEETLFDASGFMMAGANGWAKAQYTWADASHRTSERYFDAEGAPCVAKDLGFAGVDRVFDENMRITRFTYYDATGQIGPNADGAIIVTREYDDYGYLSLRWYYDAAGEPTLYEGIGAYGEAYERDENGLVLRHTFLSPDGYMMNGKEGWATVTYTWADAKHAYSERYYDAGGKPVVLADRGYSVIDREYDDKMRVTRFTYYDETGYIGPNADGVVIVTREFDDNGRLSLCWYYGADGKPMLNEAIGAFGEAFEYDDKGNVARDILLDAEGYMMNGVKGWAVAEYVWADAEHKTSEHYTDAAGAPVVVEGGYTGVERVFDDQMRTVSITYFGEDGKPGPNAKGVITLHIDYNDIGRAALRSYFDAEGQPMLYKEIGAYAESFDYDGKGNVTRDTLLDGEGAPMMGPNGWAEARYEWADAKHKTRERYFDADLRPVLLPKVGHSGVDRVFDELMRTVEITYYGADGLPGPNADGVITQKTEYNEAGKASLKRYFGADGQPMKLASVGAFGQALEYDAAGNITRDARLNAAGDPMVGSEGWATALYTWADPEHKLTERYLDAAGKPAMMGSGYSGRDTQYDEKMRVTQVTFYDANGQVGPNAGGFSIMRYEYGEDGRSSKVFYYDAAGQPTQHQSLKAYGRAYTYDDKGRVIRDVRLNPEGYMMNGAEGWAYADYTWADGKHKLSEHYYDENAKPFLIDGSYSGVEREYDERFNPVRTVYYDATGEIGYNAAGEAIITEEYNDKNKVIRRSFFSPDGAPELNARVGAYSRSWAYDENGYTTCLELYDADGALMVGANGWARVTYVRDEKGRSLDERFFGADGELIALPSKYARVTREYNDRGDITLIAYYGADGELTTAAQGYAMLRTEYDGKNALTEIYYGADGEPMVYGKVGAAMVTRALDDKGQIVRESYFDVAGAAMINAKTKCATIVYERDEAGRAVSESYFGLAGEKISVSGAHTVARAYDDNGRAIRVATFNTKGEAVYGADGYAAVAREFDDEGRVICERYYGLNGEPVKAKSGAGMVLFTYGGEGEVTKSYFDTAGNAAAVNGCHQVLTVRDSGNRIVREMYFDDKGDATAGKDGFAGYYNEYDERGNIVQVSYYDTKGGPGVSASGTSRIVRTWDEKNRKTSESYFGPDGAPHYLASGYCSVVYTYNEAGKTLSQTYLNADGEPVESSRTGYAAIVYDYDAASHKIRETYYGADLNMKALDGGYATMTWTYDEAGELSAVRYFGPDGESVMSSDGYAGYERSLSEDGLSVTLTYMNTDWVVRAPSADMTHSMLLTTYDEKTGYKLREDYLDARGLPTANRDGVFATIYDYDAQGRVIRQATLGRDGQLYSGRLSYAAIEYFYDRTGKKTQKTYGAAQYDWDAGYTGNK